ncbi:hypothetical protein [Enterococcus sp. N249-2]
MANKQEYKLNDGFEVSKFMMLIDVDFIYSTKFGSSDYLLLNQQMFGTFEKSQIDNQKLTKKVIIIYNDTLRMESFNVPEEDLINAFMSMGSK